jgi:hypothetical protein
MGDVVGDLAGYRAADLYPVVSEAFADYVIPLRADPASLDALLTRRGWEPAWSFGLFRRGRLAGFWLTGRDDSRTEAYCIMTGILPEGASVRRDPASADRLVTHSAERRLVPHRTGQARRHRVTGREPRYCK